MKLKSLLINLIFIPTFVLQADIGEPLTEENELIHFYIVRHAETYSNLKGVYQGWRDGENAQLTEKGIYQAKKAAEYFKQQNLDFDQIYSSPLGRAKKTAESVCSVINKTFILHDGFKAMSWGDYEGTPINAKIDHLGGISVKEYSALHPDWVVPNGESTVQVKQRLIQTIDEIAQSHFKNILIFTHHEDICVLFNLLKSPLSYEDIPNCGFVHLTYDPKQKTLHLIGSPIDTQK